MIRIGVVFVVYLLGAIFANAVFAAQADDNNCENVKSAFYRRLCSEEKISKQKFVLVPYKPNYFIVSHVDGLSNENPEYQNYETKFQISFKIPLSDYERDTTCFGIRNTNCIAFFGFTQLSVWQMTNFAHSAPFRDSNFEPELMVSQLFDNSADDSWHLRMINYGLIDHQSNGKVPPTSRSWNRTYVDFVFGSWQNYITLKLWKRWNETPKANVTDFRGDDNPDILKYAGHGELKLFHAGQKSNYSVQLRDSERNPNKINVQLNYSYPVRELFHAFDDSTLRVYVQYFNGYGETLIDYNIKRERFGVGVMLADWL